MRNILIISMLLICNVSLWAQGQKTTQELLMSTNWEPQDTFYEGDCGYVKYTSTQDLYVEKIDNKIDRVYSDYYLSSSPDTVFDINKVGKNSMGIYIIRKGAGYVFISKILELTPTKLVVKNLTPGFTTTGKITVYLATNANF